MKKVKVTQEKLMAEMLDSLSSARLSRIIASIADLVDKKNADYGDAWQTFGCFTALVRINDKILRVENMSDGKRALIMDESIVDNLRDTIGYAALALMWLEENTDVTKQVEVD